MRKYLLLLVIIILILQMGCNKKENDEKVDAVKSKWPTLNNTGIPDSAPALTIIEGNRYTTKDNEVFDAVEFRGRLYVNHKNVLIKRSKLTGDQYYAVYTNTSGTGLTIEDCDITGGVRIGDGFTGRRNHLYAAEGKSRNDGWIFAASNVVLEDNLINGLKGSTGAHLDGIQVMGGDNIVIKNNWIEAVSPEIMDGGVNAAIFLSPDKGEISNVTIEGNMLIEKDGYYPLRINAKGRVSVTNNVWRKGHLGGAYRIIDTVIAEWKNNKYEDGEIIAEPKAAKVVTSIEISVKELLLIGESTTATALTVYSDNISDNSIEQWRSSNDAIAAITTNGVITAVGLGSVTISAIKGGIKAEKAITVVSAIEETKKITIGVWMQSPTRERNGIPNVITYKKLGINTYIGLWQWPTENWAYSGYTMKTAKALKENGMKVYAGNNDSAVEWNKNNPDYADTFIGYMLGDEADMFKVNYNPDDPASVEKWSWTLPDNWKSAGDDLKMKDPTREIYANFGKPFAGGHYSPMPGSTRELDFEKYVGPTNVYSCDFYGMTDPYEARNNHGIWTYGRAVKNAIKHSGGRPVLGFLEVSSPWKISDNEKQLAKEMRAEWVKPIVWNMIISGAKGIVYFCHNFLPEKTGGEAACLDEPGMPEAMADANSSIQKYADILLSDDVSGITVTTTGAVDVVFMTKKYKGFTYIFAMGNGNSGNIEGADVECTFSIPAKIEGVAVVENENRDIAVSNGEFTDNFKPYEVHIYKIAD